MILLIDNYDSFSYNLYQLIGQVNKDIEVYRNDKITADEIKDLNTEAIILSPGPGVGGHCISVDPWFLVGDYPGLANIILAGRPEDAGICVDVVRKL